MNVNRKVLISNCSSLSLNYFIAKKLYASQSINIQFVSFYNKILIVLYTVTQVKIHKSQNNYLNGKFENGKFENVNF